MTSSAPTVGQLFRRTVRPHPANRTHRPHADLQPATPACRTHRIRPPLQRSTTPPRPQPSPTTADPPRHEPQPSTHHASTGSGWPDQRVRTGGVKPLLNTAGRLLEPHSRWLSVRADRHTDETAATIGCRKPVWPRALICWRHAFVCAGHQRGHSTRHRRAGQLRVPREPSCEQRLVSRPRPRHVVCAAGVVRYGGFGMDIPRDTPATSRIPTAIKELCLGVVVCHRPRVARGLTGDVGHEVSHRYWCRGGRRGTCSVRSVSTASRWFSLFAVKHGIDHDVSRP
jgi:hypothetical protein